jgi:hypothetical protein
VNESVVVPRILLAVSLVLLVATAVLHLRRRRDADTLWVGYLVGGAGTVSSFADVVSLSHGSKVVTLLIQLLFLAALLWRIVRSLRAARPR